MKRTGFKVGWGICQGENCVHNGKKIPFANKSKKLCENCNNIRLWKDSPNEGLKRKTRLAQAAPGKKPKPLKQRKNTAMNKQKKATWRWCSLYIRVRDANKEGFVKCCTCPKVLPVQGSGLQAGHWRQSGNHSATRYDERNISGQCDQCNVMKHGLESDHERHLRAKWGNDAIDDVYKKSFMQKKWSVVELMALEKDFKERALAIAKKKGIQLRI